MASIKNGALALGFTLPIARRAVINRLPVLSVVVAAAIALIIVAPAAYADSMDVVVVAHRGASTSKYAEGTLRAYKYAVRNDAEILDADVRWTKDGHDSDSVGTMIILHDRTLDRISNCHGRVSKWRWSSIRAKCRTDVGGQRLMRLIDLLRYGNSLGKSFTLEIKLRSIANAQAKQFWNAIKYSRVQLVESTARLATLNKIKKLDEADLSHRISYALRTRGRHGWPSVSAIKNTVTAVYAKPTIPVTVARRYRQANIEVFLSTGKNEADYAKMIARKPYAVVVNDVARFERWCDDQ
jgi:glycerophosphoryl diester phosphodiesterase